VLCWASILKVTIWTHLIMVIVAYVMVQSDSTNKQIQVRRQYNAVNSSDSKVQYSTYSAAQCSALQYRTVMA
jgi:hypothetical protein